MPKTRRKKNTASRIVRQLTRRRKPLHRLDEAVLEQTLNRKLGQRSHAVINGINVFRLQQGKGIHLIKKSSSRQSKETPEYAEVWNANNVYTWFVPDNLKLELHDIRVGKRTFPRTKATSRVAKDPKDVSQLSRSKRHTKSLANAVKDGEAMPFYQEQLQNVVRSMVVTGITLVVPDTLSYVNRPIVDFLPQSSRGMVVGLWGEGLQNTVLKEREVKSVSP